MSRPRVTLVVNPAAGLGRAARCAGAVADRLARGAEVTTVGAADPAGSRRLVRAAADQGATVVVLGGDGIVHLAAQELAGTPTVLGIVAAGTGNDTAGSLGLPADPIQAADALAAALRAGSVRRIDAGRVDAAGPPRWWLTVLCAGFDSAVAERADRLRWPRGPRRYDLAIALEALRLAPRPYVLHLDGERREMEAIMISVANGPRYGGGKLIAPSARLDDGRFTVCVIAPISRLTLARLAPLLDRGGHVEHPAVRFYPATRVRIDARHVAYADGERIGPLPVDTTCVAGALRVLAPPD